MIERLSTAVSLGCLLAGIALILSTALPALVALSAVLAWSAYLSLSLRRLPIRRLRDYAKGDVHLQLADGRWLEGRVAAGSLFLANVAWLRVEGRTPYRGWFMARDAAPAEWRRLRVIARHFADI